MKSYRIAERYARVLIHQAVSGKQLEKVSHDVANIALYITGSEGFADFLNNPIISVPKRQEIIAKLFKHKLDPLTHKFLLFVAKKERLSELLKICEIFQKLYDEVQNTLRVTLTSVCPLRHDQIAAVAEKLKHFFHKDDVHIETHMDESLVGGFKVQVGDLIYDYSIRTQLKTYHEAVLKA